MVPGTTSIAIACSGLNPSQSLLPAFASPLAGVLTNFNLTAATALLPAGFPTPVTSDSSGNLTTTQTVPSQTVGSDPDAQCPPSQDQVNRGLLFCAFAVADINATNYGNALLQYPGQPTPANPTLNLNPTTGTAGTSISVSGGNWWGGGITGGPIPVGMINVSGTVATTSSVSEVAPAYTINNSNSGGTLTGGTLTCAFTSPSGTPIGNDTAFIDQTNPGGFPGNGPGNDVEDSAALTVNAAPPTVTNVSPNGGTTAGGTSVTITGTNLASASAVSFGGTAATGFTPVNDTTVTATSPVASAGTVDAQVTTLGGTSVVITGLHLAGVSAVTFGGTPAASFSVVDDNTVNAVSPAGAGIIDVRVTSPQGMSLVNAGDQFTYVAPPTVTKLKKFAKTKALISGGDGVTITGSGFTNATGRQLRHDACGQLVNDTAITAITPVMVFAGPVDLTVTNVGGTSAINEHDV